MRRLKAVGGIFREARLHYAIEHRGCERLARPDWLWIFFQNRSEYAELRLAFESAPSRHHLVQNASETEQVAARVRLPALQKLRSHVLKCADDRTLLRERRRNRGE